MSTETLFTAARRAVRDFNIDMNKGGIITVPTQRTLETLSQMVIAAGRAGDPPEAEAVLCGTDPGERVALRLLDADAHPVAGIRLPLADAERLYDSLADAIMRLREHPIPSPDPETPT